MWCHVMSFPVIVRLYANLNRNETEWDFFVCFTYYGSWPIKIAVMGVTVVVKSGTL